jgi:hypothetical protein
MNPKTDKTGNLYFDRGNVRITILKQTWAGCPGIRIQSYKGKTRRLHRGAEVPLPDRASAGEVIQLVARAILELRL